MVGWSYHLLTYGGAGCYSWGHVAEETAYLMVTEKLSVSGGAELPGSSLRECDQ